MGVGPADNEPFRAALSRGDNYVTVDKPEITAAIGTPDPIMRIIKTALRDNAARTPKSSAFHI